MKFREDCVEIIYLQLANYGNVSGEMCWVGLIRLRIVFSVQEWNCVMSTKRKNDGGQAQN